MRCCDRPRTLVALTLVVMATAGLCGCGRRGALEPPPDASVQAPNPDAGDAAVPAFRRPKAPPITPPHEPFILDPIL